MGIGVKNKEDENEDMKIYKDFFFLSVLVIACSRLLAFSHNVYTWSLKDKVLSTLITKRFTFYSELTTYFSISKQGIEICQFALPF